MAARGEEEEEAGGAGWVKLMVRSTGDGVEEDWAVDLAVSKLVGGGRGSRVEAGEGRGGVWMEKGEKVKHVSTERTEKFRWRTQHIIGGEGALY